MENPFRQQIFLHRDSRRAIWYALRWSTGASVGLNRAEMLPDSAQIADQSGPLGLTDVNQRETCYSHEYQD